MYELYKESPRKAGVINRRRTRDSHFQVRQKLLKKCVFFFTSAPLQQAGWEQGIFKLEISQQAEWEQGIFKLEISQHFLMVGKARQLSSVPKEVVYCLGLEVLGNS